LRDDRLASSSANPLIKALVNNLNDGQDGKISQFALQTDDITFFKKRFIEKGIPYVGPLEGSRVNDQGVGLKWQMLFPIGKDEEQLPFLIEWENEWQERTAGFPMNDKVLERLFFRGLSLARFHDIYGTHAVVRNELLLKNCRLSLFDEGYSHIHFRSQKLNPLGIKLYSYSIRPKMIANVSPARKMSKDMRVDPIDKGHPGNIT